MFFVEGHNAQRETGRDTLTGMETEMERETKKETWIASYGVATMSRMLKNLGL